MKKPRMKKGMYREFRKKSIEFNEKAIAADRKEGKFDRYQRFRMHTWFIAYQKRMKIVCCEKEGEEIDESFKL